MLTFFIVKEEDATQFEYIYSKYKNTVYAIIYRYVNNTAMAEDVMQETFVSFLKTMGRLRTEDDMRRWLFKIAKNASLDCLDKESRSQKRITIRLDDTNAVTNYIDENAIDPLDDILKQELSEKISEVFDTLKPIHANVMRLRYFLGYTPDEIAKMSNVPVPTIYSRLSKARNLLFSKLSFVKQEYSELIGGVADEKQ